MDILHGPLGGNILRFSASLAATGILQQLFNAADVAVVGRFVGKAAMAAVGSNTPIVGLLVNLFVGVSLGSNVVLAHLTGQGDTAGVRRAVDTSLLLALLCGAFATLTGELAAAPVLRMMSVPPEVFPMALAYLRIYLLGVPVILLYNFEAAIFRSQGDSFTPLVCLTASGVINVGLNLVFVVLCGMTADGVALATVLSNGVSALALAFLLYRTDSAVSIRGRKLRPDMAMCRKIFRIGLPAGLQNAVFSISNICIQSAINSLGSDVMAASSAAFNIEITSYYVVNSFSQACTTFTGQNHGAGNDERCRAVFRKCLWMDLVLTVVISGGILLLGTPLLHIFNRDPAVVAFGMTRLRVILLTQWIDVFIEIFSGAMRGYGRSLIPALASLVGICGVRIVWVYTVFADHRTFYALLMSYPISWVVTTAALAVAYLLMLRSLRRESAATV
jgi:putative MATE family efflux protein